MSFQKYPRLVLKLIILFGIFYGWYGIAHARLVPSHQITVEEGHYKIQIDFLIPIYYQSHLPYEASEQFRIQLFPVNYQQLTQDEIDDLRAQINLGWDESTGIPLQEMTFEGGNPDRPQLTLIFTEEVNISAWSSADLLSLIVLVVRKKPAQIPEPVPPEVGAPEYLDAENSRFSAQMSRGNAQMRAGNYEEAIREYRQLVQVATGVDLLNALEYLGYAYEQSGQKDKAAEQYRQYLKTDPQAAFSDRVRKRLKRVEYELIKGAVEVTEKREKQRWKSRNYGVLSQFFYKDQTTPSGNNRRPNRYEWITDLDLNSRFHNETWEIFSQLSLAYINKLQEGSGDVDTLDAMNVQVKQNKKQISGKFGRQFKGTEGMFDIFDGAYLSAKAADKVTLNAFFGYPVVGTARKKPDTDRRFKGVSVKWGSFQNKWDLTTYYFHQENQGKIGRQALGTEFSYYESSKALYASADYDIYFDQMNVFTANGWWTLPTKTTLSFFYDYRYNPLLTLNNSLFSLAISDLSPALETYDLGDLKRLAEKGSAVSKSLTMSVTQQIKKDLQATGNITVFEFEGVETVLGVTGFAGTGVDYFYSMQIVKNNFIKNKDALLTDFGFSTTATYYGYSLRFSLQYPVIKGLRVTPEVRFGYRDFKDNDNSRLTVRPLLQADYQIKKWLRFELEGGVEWKEEEISASTSTTNDLFVRAGFVVNF